jgi:hypothetical protein
MNLPGLVQLLGVAGVLVLASRSRQRRQPDASRCAWVVPNPIPIEVLRRAQAIHAIGAPLGTEYVEEVGGRIYKFTREIHGPNQQIPHWHPGVGVRLCERPEVQP